MRVKLVILNMVPVYFRTDRQINKCFFNETDIEEVYFKGYEDEAEEAFQKKYRQEIG